MPTGVFFKAVDVIPASGPPGTLYFQKRPDGELDIAATGLDGIPVIMRRPHLQMQFRARGTFIPANEEFGRFLTKEDMNLDALLSGAVADAPATADAVFTVSRGVDLVARFTFPAGQSAAIPEIIIPYVPKDNLLIFRTPLAQDATLNGVTGTLGARRL